MKDKTFTHKNFRDKTLYRYHTQKILVYMFYIKKNNICCVKDFTKTLFNIEISL